MRARRSALDRPRAGAEARLRGWPWALLGGVLGLALTLALWAPARWLASALQQATAGQLRLVNPRGTVWNGSAGVVLASGAGGAEAVSLPGQLSWRLRPQGLGLGGTLELPCCASEPLGFAVRRQDGGLWLGWQDSASRWPAAMLAGLGAPWNTLRPEGTLELRTQALVLHWRDGGNGGNANGGGAELAIGGGATLDAIDIASSLATLRPLGSYRVALTGGSAPSVLLTTLGGSLQLTGSGLWTGRALRFSGEAAAAPGSENALSNLLNIMGRREGTRSIITLG